MAFSTVVYIGGQSFGRGTVNFYERTIYTRSAKMIIDTHAHLYWESFLPDYQAMLQRAVAAGVTHVINIGVSVETSQKAANLKSDKIKFFSSIGLHPHEAVKYATNPDVSIHADIDKLGQLYQSQPDQPFDSAQGKIVAVGECGLDFLFESNPGWIPFSLNPDQVKDLQRKLFQAQIDLAKKLKLPLLVHCRDDRTKNPQDDQCWNEVISMLGFKQAVLHCYSGLSKTTNLVLSSTNHLFSFAGNITYPKNGYLLEAIKVTPLERILVETDCPFLPPQQMRGKRNEPSFITETVKLISQIKNLSAEKVVQATFENAGKIGLIKL